MKYVLYVDYRANEARSYEYKMLDAKNMVEAVSEADKIYNPSKMYLVRIMERRGKVEKIAGVSTRVYEAMLCKRSLTGGWHENISENSESEHCARYFYMKNISWFEVV